MASWDVAGVSSLCGRRAGSPQGAARFAPANTRMNHLDAVDGSAQAVVTYLMGNQDMRRERE
jgi:hypothetical protein